MIEPALVLDGMRDQLREIVLPALDDEQARGVVIAALGILADLALQVRDDDSWCRGTVRRLHAIFASRRSLPGGEDVTARVEELVAQAKATASPAAARSALLDAAVLVIRALWRDGGQAQHGGLLDDLRRVLSVDLNRELERTR